MNFVDLGCCGMKELSGISGGSPESCLDFAVNGFNAKHHNRGFRAGSTREGSIGESVPQQAIVIFSSADYTNGNPPSTYGDTFAAYLRDQKLGRVEEVVTITKGIINPNTQRRLRVWHWYVDMGAFRRWRVDLIKRETDKFFASQAVKTTATTRNPISPSAPPS